MSICAVIVTYNSSRLIRKCLQCVAVDPDVDMIVVVDNSPNTNTAEAVRDYLHAADEAGDRPSVQLLTGHGNIGFARACNLGAEVCRKDSYLAFLNPDVELVAPLRSLIDVLEDTPAVIAAGGLVSDAASIEVTNARRGASLPREYLKAAFGSGTYVVKHLPRTPDPVPVGQLDGALLLMARATFAALDGFDEIFELYYEDVDLCHRAHALGDVVLIPTVWGVHIGGASSQTISHVAYGVSRVSRIRWARKRYGDTHVISGLLAMLAFLEALARTVTGQQEGMRTRLQSLREQGRELRHPESVQLLSRGEH